MATVKTIVARLKALKANAPEDTQLVVTTLTPSGDVMQIVGLREEGFNIFSADGYVDGGHCEMVAHVATLKLFCSFKSTKSPDKRPVYGFLASLSEPQKESGQ